MQEVTCGWTGVRSEYLYRTVFAPHETAFYDDQIKEYGTGRVYAWERIEMHEKFTRKT
jgi:hypothetical protein